MTFQLDFMSESQFYNQQAMYIFDISFIQSLLESLKFVTIFTLLYR
jgi:hypothetical protein